MASKKRPFFEALGLDSKSGVALKKKGGQPTSPTPASPAAGSGQDMPSATSKSKAKKKRKNKAHPPQAAKDERSATSTSPAPTPKGAVPQYPYAVDFCDHFETPVDAYRHVEPLLFWLAQASVQAYGDLTVVDRVGAATDLVQRNM